LAQTQPPLREEREPRPPQLTQAPRFGRNFQRVPNREAAISQRELNHNARRGNEGGGGGGICTPARCITLAEAGLRMDAQGTADFRLTVEQVRDMEDVISAIPTRFDRRDFQRRILGQSRDYVVASETDVAKFQQFRAEYVRLLRNTPFAPEVNEGFQLLAVTQGDKTYLLPGFDKLNLRSRSLILIHEGLIRSYGASVQQALVMDGLVLTALNDATAVDVVALGEILSDLRIAGAPRRSSPSLRVIDGLLEVEQVRAGRFTRVTRTVLRHRTCILKIENSLPNGIARGLMNNGFILDRNPSIDNGDLTLRELDLAQIITPQGCVETRLTGFIHYAGAERSLSVAGGSAQNSCQYNNFISDAERTTESLFPTCESK
jgi:hypothetical protein